VTALARASTCAYNALASKFVMKYWIDKIKEGSLRSCRVIVEILGPTTQDIMLSLQLNNTTHAMDRHNICLPPTL